MTTRLFVSEPLGNGTVLVLGGEQARYLGRVLRSRVGDTIVVFNGEGGEWTATVDAIGKSAVNLTVGDCVASGAESPLKLHLVQGISRGERMDFVVQKATELGVKRITPVVTDHGVVKLDEKRATKRRDHWQKVAESACEQSGRTRPPLLDLPTGLNAWFGRKGTTDSTELVLDPRSPEPLASVAAPVTKLCLLVGPEGGFSDREYEDAKIAGFMAVSIGPRILRTETAAIASLAIAQSLWGDI